MQRNRKRYIDDDACITVGAEPEMMCDFCEADLDRQFIELEKKIKDASDRNKARAAA